MFFSALTYLCTNPRHLTQLYWYTTSQILSVQSFKETYFLKTCFVWQIEEKLKIKGFTSKSSIGFILTFFLNLGLLVMVSRSGVTQQQESKLAWIAYTASLISSATICVIILPKEMSIVYWLRKAQWLWEVVGPAVTLDGVFYIYQFPQTITNASSILNWN